MTTQHHAPTSRPPRSAGSKAFARLWSAYTINVAGDEFYTLAVPLIVYQVGGTAGAMSLVYACTLFPQVAMGVLGGVLADRRERVQILRWCYLACALSLLTAFAVFWTDQVTIAGIAVVALVLGALAPVSAAAFDSAVPQFVASDRLSRANASTEASRTVCVVLGPAAAGFIVGHLAPEYAILVNSLSFVAAYALLHRMRRPTASLPLNKDGTSPWTDLKTGLRYVLREASGVRLGIIASTVVNFVFGAYEPMVVYRLREDLGLSASAVGLTFAVSGVVSVGVALLLSWKAPSRGFHLAMGAGIAVQGLAVAALGYLPSLTTVITAQIFFVTGMLVYTVYWRAMRQTFVPGALLGRVAGLCRSIAYTGAFLGSIASAAVLGRFVSVSVALLVAGAVAAVMGMYLIIYGWRTAKETRESA